MPGIGLWAQKNMLDWCLKGAAPTAPPNVYCGLAVGAPTSVASSEVATGSGYLRQTAQFGPAQTPAGSGSASNSSAMTFGPFSSSQAVTGLFLSDTVSSNAGNMLWFGQLATARTPLPGDSLVIAVGALQVTLN